MAHHDNLAGLEGQFARLTRCFMYASAEPLLPVQMPQHTITILLGLVFCIMNPIITPVCLIYFLIITVTEKYNLLYVYTFEYQSGGQVTTCIIPTRC